VQPASVLRVLGRFGLQIDTSSGIPPIFFLRTDRLSVFVVIFRVCARLVPSRHSTHKHCFFLRFGDSRCLVCGVCCFPGRNFFVRNVGRGIPFFAFGNQNHFTGGFQ